MKRRLSTIAGLGVLIALGLGPAPDATAQDSTIVTVPCDGCGPGTGAIPGRARAWAFPQHVCQPDGTSRFLITAGIGRNAPSSPVTFYVRWAGSLERPLAPAVAAGSQHTFDPGIVVAPGETVVIDVGAFGPTGTPVKFGDGSWFKTFTLTCDCPQPPTTTTPPTTTPPTTTPPTTPSTVPPTTVTTSPPVTTTPPTSTPVTTPGTPTVPPPSSVPGIPPGITELPSVGVPEWLRWAALIAIGLLVVGAGAVRWGREAQ